MSRKAKCWDNTVAESFFNSLKKEQIKMHIYTALEIAKTQKSDYIDTLHNRIHRHSHQSGVSPKDLEAMSIRAY